MVGWRRRKKSINLVYKKKLEISYYDNLERRGLYYFFLKFGQAGWLAGKHITYIFHLQKRFLCKSFPCFLWFTDSTSTFLVWEGLLWDCMHSLCICASALPSVYTVSPQHWWLHQKCNKLELQLAEYSSIWPNSTASGPNKLVG